MPFSLWDAVVIGLAAMYGGACAFIVVMRRLDLRRRLAERELDAANHLEETIAKRRRRLQRRQARLRRRADAVTDG